MLSTTLVSTSRSTAGAAVCAPAVPRPSRPRPPTATVVLATAPRVRNRRRFIRDLHRDGVWCPDSTPATRRPYAIGARSRLLTECPSLDCPRGCPLAPRGGPACGRAPAPNCGHRRTGRGHGVALSRRVLAPRAGPPPRGSDRRCAGGTDRSRAYTIDQAGRGAARTPPAEAGARRARGGGTPTQFGCGCDGAAPAAQRTRR